MKTVLMRGVCVLVFLVLCVERPAQAEDVQPRKAPTENTAQEKQIYDPIQGINRGIFWFNDKLDVYLAEPVARGYDDVVPTRVQLGIDNFFKNLQFPAFFVSDLVQLKFKQALSDTGRFLINSTVGLGGLMDIAKDAGLERHKEDFGVALAYWGVPSGPYLMLPILGPSNLRDATGLLVDLVLDPVFWIANWTDLKPGEEVALAMGLKTIQFVNTRAGMLEAMESAKESSLDYYLFVQSAYDQYREGIVRQARSGKQGGDSRDSLSDGDPLDDDLLDDDLLDDELTDDVLSPAEESP
ncbi:MAG: VacJ family lipoprotein [Deltaproteobacteria bacterium]|nr:VacJ family lipoprotein [Deltaproteobacteria bacterium]